MDADIFIVVGTSLAVYPAASLLEYVRGNVPVYIVDPNEPDNISRRNVVYLQEKASIGVPMLYKQLTGHDFAEG